MKSFFLILIVTVLYSCSSKKTNTVVQDEMCWKYNVPAKKYWEGLPIGTGRFAGMVMGKIADEVITFNDETLWTGGPYNPNNPKGYPALKNIRKYVLEEDYVSATKESYNLGSIPEMVQHYQPMGALNLHFEGHDLSKVTNYERKLSMDSALVSVSYNYEGVAYKREIFASYPEQVIVVRLYANKKGKINISAWLNSLQPSASYRVEEDRIIMQGTTIDMAEKKGDVILPPELRWQSVLKVMVEGDGEFEINKKSKRIKINNADAVTLILAGATNWVNWNDVSADEKECCNKYISGSGKYNYSELKQRHVDDYIPLFNKCKIDLGKNENSTLSTTERIERLKSGEEDPLYISQYFHFGRYLLLASARENTLAFNNHNIWLNNMEGRWRGRWTLNINIQECYWPVETTNLTNVNNSLLLFVENLAQAGARTAKELYGCRGWTAHHGTDIWFNTCPTDADPHHATWPMSGAWLMQQLFDHYLYEPDTKYLKRIYPLLKGAAEFFIDFMITDPKTGWLVTCPSTSPENVFYTKNKEIASVSMGASMDNQIIRRLFSDCIKACNDLKIDNEFKTKLENAIEKLPPHQIGKYGQLQEWLYDFEEREVGHRHLSHLYAFYPDDDISLRKTPELAKSVKKVIERRGNINRGWSGAWKINLYARLEEPDVCYDILKKMLTEKSIHPFPEDSEITPSYEGNQGIQGITAGIAEMLMQSHSGEISILPALPKHWSKGGVQGLRAKGGYDIDIFWENGKLANSVIYSKFDNKCRVRAKQPIKVISEEGEIEQIKIENNLIEFNTNAGNSYKIVCDD